ncbi:hypothetical protein [Nocardioides xinjiangensis]|uniref:hypothetical protein n=1 Tax=Nocardioides xinjiangensis TaxID=2817376 RepID=UPI001B313441|nr:hypothetical protein [Nocardioides sp. SYSU D00514]
METAASLAIGLLQTASVLIVVAGVFYLVALKMVLSAGRKTKDHHGDADINTKFGSKFSISYKASTSKKDK